MGLNIKPLADRVLVEPAPAETKTEEFNTFIANNAATNTNIETPNTLN